MSQQTGQILHFGDYELDPASRSLRRSGNRVPLHARSFDVLLFLAEHAGQVVTREDLLKGVWKDAFVDDNSVTQSISSLRKAFAERPGENTLIATLPGRGYQFLPAVHSVAAAPVPTAATPGAVLLESRTIRTSIVTEQNERIGRGDQAWTRSRGWFGRRTSLAVVAVIVLGACGWAAWRALRPGPYEHVETVIADLDNETGDTQFDHSLNKLLQVDLQQSPFFTVVSDGRVHRTLRMMNQATEESLTAPLAREVCQRLNSQVYIAPSIAVVGKRFLVTLVVNDCQDGHAVGARHKEVTSKDDVLGAFSDLIPKMRHDVGESRGTLNPYDNPLYSEMNTSSLEALKAYSEGERLGDAGKFPEAIALMKRAVALDPKMAVAWADLGTFSYNIGDKQGDIAAITKAYALRDTVGERERLYLIYHYTQNATGDLHAELDALRQWSSLYPDDNLPIGSLVNLETWTGQYAQAAMHADQGYALEKRLGVRNGLTREIYARAYFHANLPDKVRAIYDESVQMKIDTAGLHSTMLELAADNGDSAGIDRQIAWARGTAPECHILQVAAFAALSAGQAHRAAKLFADATAAAQRDKLTETLADLNEYYARMLIDMGLANEAKKLYMTLPQADSSLDKLFTEAEIGSPDHAVSEAKRLAAAAPTDTLLNAEYVPSVLAIADIQSGRGDDAVRLMQASEPYELRDPTVPYLRGKAFLAAHKGAEAEAEFNKILSRPWIADPITPLSTLAELELARTFAMEGQIEKADAAYRHFLADWSTADPDLPVLAAAKAEDTSLTARR